MTNKELVKLVEIYISQRIMLAVPVGQNRVPSKFHLGAVKGVSSSFVDGFRVLKFDSLQFLDERESGKSILIQEGGVIDFTYCK